MAHRYPLKLLLAITALIIFNGLNRAFAQKPDITYPTPQNYTTNTPIAPLSPKNKGGAVPATTYSQVSSVAGNDHTIGSIDGTGSAASFVEPDGMAVDAAGNIYIVEVASSVVRKVTPQGVVTTFAGSGLPGKADGQGTAARFNNPKGIAIDAAGNLYVTDYTNGLIRKITPSGLVSTFAGSGAGGSIDGMGTAATFQRPTGIAIDAAGYLYVTEETNIIRRISPSGQVVRWAGSGAAGAADGTYTQAQFNDPAGIAIDAAGNLYVTDRGNKLIRKITPGQVVTTIAGNGNFGATNGPALSASFSYPTGIAIDASGTIYIADWGSNLVRKLSPEGIVSTYAGNGSSGPTDGVGTGTAFNLPAGVVIDSYGNLYVSEYNNNMIRLGIITGYIIDKPLPPGLTFSPATGIITGTPTSAWPSTDYTVTAYNAGGSSSFTFNITVHDAAPVIQPPNIIYQTPQNYTTNTPITALSPSNSGGAVVGIAGQVTTFAGDGTTGAKDGTGTGAGFSGPQLLRFDPASGNFYMVDAPNLVRKITPGGAVTTFTTNFGKIQGLAIDASGNLFIADVDNNVIWKMTAGGTVTKYAGGARGIANGTLATAQFDGIFGLAFDSKGNLFVSDYNNRLIRKIDPAGNVTTFAGTLGISASVDGTGTGAKFTAPNALTVDQNDNLWVADDNTLIRRITSQGVVNTIAGNGSNLGTAQGTAAKFNGVLDLVPDPAGNIYVADNYYGLIKKITPSGLVTLVTGALPPGYNDGLLQSSNFSGPFGIAFDNQGKLFIADDNNRRVREVGLSGYIIDKPLPAGLSFDQATGVISGTPTVASPLTAYTVTAFNAGGSSSFTINIAVSDPLPALQPPDITYQTPQNYILNTTINPLVPQNTGGAVPTTPSQVSTVAGNGNDSHSDGTGITAGFWGPELVKMDRQGNIYVVDYPNVIRKATPAGVVTTLPTNFGQVEGIAFDAANNLYVADIDNCVIWKVTPAGVISKFAGTTRGFANGPAATAKFDSPSGLVFDSKGNLFVADFNNHAIRKIDPSGNVTTFAGQVGSPGIQDGTGTGAQFMTPNPLTIDKLDNIYLVDNNITVRKVTPAGVVTSIAFGSNAGHAADAPFGRVFDLTTDNQGNILLADQSENLIIKITPTGVITIIAGNGTAAYKDGAAFIANFNLPFGIAFDGLNNFYIGDSINRRLRKLTLYGYTIDKTLPAGLAFDPATGTISGTPTATSPATDYIVTAYNDGGSSSFTVRISVNNTLPALQPPDITYQSPQYYKVGKTITPLAPNNNGGDVPADAYGVSTFAGSTGSSGTFSAPYGLRTDGSGNLYVSDASQRIMKITPDGVLTTIAGTKNVTGNANGQGSSALFNNPGQIATDLQGNIYVADINNNKIRKITPAGLVTTYAGTGATGSNNGSAATSTFFHPTGIAVDAAGNVYVADHDNNVIRKITPGGTVSTFAGLAGSAGAINGNGTSARFSGPTYLAADALGNIYVADNNNQMVRKISQSGDVTTLAGNGTAGFNNGAGTSATFNGLGGLTTDIYGDVYVVDKGNYVVRKITPGGTVSTFAGSGVKGAVNGNPLTAKFAGSTDITIDDEGNLFLADGGQVREITTGGYTIDKPLPLGLNFDPTTGVISGTPAAVSPLTNYVVTAYNISGGSSFTIQISVDPADATAVQPPIISYETPQVYTATKTITPLSPTNTGGAVPVTVFGQVSTFAGSGVPGAVDGLGKAASFSYPVAIALDPAGNFYVTETVNSLVRQITPGAVVSTYAGKAGKTGYADGQGPAALFANPTGVAIDGAGNIYVADAVNNRIRKITPGGLVSTYAGNGAAGSANGAALQASFNNPTGLAIDVSGNLYVVDQKNNLIREISAGGIVSTFAGNGSAGNANGTALQASFNQPQGIAIDASGDIYVSDQNYIRKISSGTVSTFAGSGAQGSADGLGTAASFNHPYGITADVNGNLYIADTGNDLIRKITPQGQVTTAAGDLQNPTNTDKNFNQPTGIVIDAAGNAFITEFWGGLANNNTQGNVITKLTLTGYVIDKVLPAGLTFDSTTGIISGAPASPSPATDYTITAYNGGGSNSFTVNITVLEKVLLPAEITFESTAFKTYGDDDFDPGATSTNTETPINYQSDNAAVATIINGLVHITGAGTATITASQDANADYLAATPVTQLLTVNQASLVIAADDQYKYQGDPNPPLTVSYYGFVYNEDQSVFTKPLNVSTTATATSAIGQYPIIVDGAEAANYTITFLPGTLNINLSPLSILIPNAFTPNGDGVNDQWHIDKLTDAFPKCLVSIYSRSGSLVFQSRGYGIPWDGTYKGAAVPFGTYYYVIDPQPGAPKLSGYVAVIH